MKYNFKCNCGNTKIVKMPMTDIKDAKIICEKCGKEMHQDWSANLQVPDYMKSSETQEMAWVTDRLKNRPSGRRKVYY